MYSIADYDKRYQPYDKSGGVLKQADWVKLPANPKGDGLQALLEYNRGLEVFSIFILLLEKTTLQKPQNRGKFLNFRDEPATVLQIAKGISLKSKVKLVEYALDVLVELNWVIYEPEKTTKTSESLAEVSGSKFRPLAEVSSSKSRVPKSRVLKSKYMDFVELTSEEHKKLITRYGENNTRKLIGALNRYIGSTGRKYKSHYYTLLNFAKRDDMPELKPPKEDAAAEQKALERKRNEIRKEYGQYYRERTTEELRAMLKSPIETNRKWLIKEILKEKR